MFLSQRIAVMVPRPGKVESELVVAASYPREPHYRTSPLYNDYCRAVSAALEGAMAHA